MTQLNYTVSTSTHGSEIRQLIESTSDLGIDSIGMRISRNIADISDAQVQEALASLGYVKLESQGERDVVAERRRQVSVEGWTSDHDDDHVDGSLAAASSSYAFAAADQLDPHSLGGGGYDLRSPNRWPVFWTWKPGTVRRMLVKAAALAMAQIDALDRAEAKSKAAS